MISVFAAGIHVVKKAIVIVCLPRITIRLDAKHGVHFFDLFTRPHRRFVFIGQKTIAVAVLNLPASLSLYLAGKHRQAVRTNRNRCSTHGYQVRAFDPLAHRSEVESIHRSMPDRQGKIMDYCPQEDLQQAHDFGSDYIGIFAPSGELVACACTPICGQAALQLTFIGHPDHWINGVMYALHVAVVEAAIRLGAQWLTYEGFFGQSDGMRYYLARCGYSPVNVTWRIAQDS